MRRWWWSAGACLAGLVLTGLVALLVPVAEQQDGRALDAVARLDGATRAFTLADAVAALANPVPYAVCAVALVAVALAQGRRAVALVVPVVFAGAELTTQALKQLLAHPRGSESLFADRIAPASWPSGHATAAMAVALMAVVVAPPRARRLVAAAGAVYALGVGVATVARASHFPSDVLGGYLVAGLWTSLALAVLSRAR